MNCSIKKSLGFGVAIYVIMFIYWSIVAGYEQGEAVWTGIVGFLVLAVVAHFAGAMLKTKNVKGILKYSISWVGVMVILDALISVRFTGWELFSSWELYVGYAIILLVPLSVMVCKCKACKLDAHQTPSEANSKVI